MDPVKTRRLFRIMSPAEDGARKVGRSARELGIRLGIDINADAENMVSPDSGGISVSPDSMWNLPVQRRPRSMGRGSTGRDNGDVVYSIEDGDLPATGLRWRPDPRNPKVHGTVEPVARVALTEYEAALARTRGNWKKRWP
jgi:hypothetical protein